MIVETTPAPSFGPVTAAERIESLDVLRGCALLGILLMNILAFAFPFAVYYNPRVMGGDTGPNLAAWWIQFVFFDGKMRALFSLCFGAGIVLLTQRAERRGMAGAADVHSRRMLWLLLFGLVQAYFIWVGDILYYYALCGLLLYPVRKLSARALLITAGALVLLTTMLDVGRGFDLKEKREKAQAAQSARQQGKTLTDEQRKAVEEWEEARKYMNPTPEQLKKDLEAYRGGWVSAFKQRAGEVFHWHSLPIYVISWDFLLMMIAGMGFMKLGVLSGERPARFYLAMGGIGYLVGLPLNAWTVTATLANNFDPVTTTFLFTTYQTGRAAVALGHLSMILLLARTSALGFAQRALARVGRMAFSNYILTSVICTLIFNGYGAGLYGKLQRWQCYVVVLGVWAVNLVFSGLWLNWFRFGPLEWAWRSLTYWKRQPMRLRPPAALAEPAAAAQKAAGSGN